jgi:hypothetical protein
MFRIGSYVTKIRNRIKQSEIEEDPQSLSARAFRRRVLEEEEVLGSLATETTSQGFRVAIYQDKGRRWRRSLLRFGLVFVGPLLAIGLIGLIVLNVVNENKVAVTVETESTTLDDIPVPPGVRAIGRARNLDQSISADIYFRQVLPNYRQNFKGAATYITSKSQDEIKKFYDSKLVEPKPPPWQSYGKPIVTTELYRTLYMRALPNGPPNSIEALVLQIEPVNKDILKKDPDYYDAQAKIGENVIVLWKSWLVPR